MPKRREIITSGGIYHVLARGVDKRQIFMDDVDHLRFIRNLFYFNNAEFNWMSTRSAQFVASGTHRVPDATKNEVRHPDVDLLAFCLMPNHYHLLIKPKSDSGLQNFIKRVNQGYSQYFNGRQKRSGALFESRYKIVPIVNEAHFAHIPYYIHLNPLDLVDHGWREGELGDLNKATEFLDSYRWSSHLDYSGVRNFPSVTSREFLLDYFGDPDKYKKSIRDWLISRRNFEWMKGMTLE